MSSYPVLNNRPIDQWRVTDLKDELRKRRLPVKGLKEELVRRLFDSIQNEQAASEVTEDVGLNAADDLQPDINVTQETTVTITEVRQETTVQVKQVDVPGSEVGQESMISGVGGPSTADVEASLSEATAAEGEMPESNAGENLAFQEVQPHMESVADPVHKNTSDVRTDETIIVNDELSTDVKLDLTAPEVMSDTIEAHKIEKQDSAPAPVDALTSDADPMDTDVSAAPVSDDGDKLTPNNGLGSSIYDEECKDSKFLNEDHESIISKPNNQVPEVSPDLGSQIKCESISSDDKSTKKNNSIEDNSNANNFDLELEAKPKMVEPSSGITSLGGDLQPLDDGKELVKNQASLEHIHATDNVDSYKKDSPEGGSPEKLNLDQSSGDESMEEDVMESKQVESSMKSDGLRETTELSSKDVKEVTLPDSAVEASSVDTKEVIAEEKPAAPAEKRKQQAEEIVANAEPIKRQRRWTGESGKVPERQTISQTVSEAPKDVFQPALKRSFGRSDSTASGGSPKEQIVPPSQKTATASLRIDRFFSSVDEAVATRNAVYNLQWPPNNGNHLVAEFVDPQEVKLKLEPPLPAAPISPATASKTPTAQPAQANPSVPHQAASPREQLPPPPLLAKPPTSDPASARERLPPTPKKPEPPVVTLDDLFRKTQASPRIYYLPLSEEEVAAKLAEQRKGKTE
ncbi:hypothetical protein PR202_ga31294 [Eleusine coracana subsp. coracana]|uniref:SAP domain-containing protein n=1 Tax=Eleusine coracana subsp. coracana TaxID=191504 RepID=A0AAV5DRA6_ELECO|nr:hypothetical protein PR202_ga31294 [Eleusine coracana subsp. coracana]